MQDKFVALGVLVHFDERKKILQVYLQKRNDFWEFPGGKIEDGELPLEAVKREIAEEVQLAVHKIKLLRFFTHRVSEVNFSFFVF